jgi:Fic family protein
VLRLADLAARLSAPTRAPALVVAAIAHAEIVDTAPFASVNGVVARAAERLVLVSRGVDPASVTVPETGHAQREQEYRVALQGYAAGGAGGVRDWLLYAARAYVAGVEASPLRG